MRCDLLVELLNLSSYEISNETTNTSSVDGSLARSLEQFIYTNIVSSVCLFGLVANLLNLLILTRRSLTRSMDRMERSVHYGLISLAVSDLLICLAILPNSFIGTGNFAHERYGFELFYQVYGQAVISTVILASTWLTTTMAASRFLAIRFPLRARQLIGKTFSSASLSTVVVLCVLFNVPRYFREEVRSLRCQTGALVFFPYPGALKRNPFWENIYHWSYFFCGILIPFASMTFSNAYLIVALRRSRFELGSESHVINRMSHSSNRVTLTLVSIVLMYIFLFVPSELLNFFFYDLATKETTDRFNITVAILNLMQTVNFSFNFILYCAIHAHFRLVLYSLVTCKRLRHPHLHHRESLLYNHRRHEHVFDFSYNLTHNHTGHHMHQWSTMETDTCLWMETDGWKFQ